MQEIKLKFLNKNLVIFIKSLSTLLILAALGLEIFNIYCWQRSLILPHSIKVINWLATLALVSHLIEAIFAIYYANKQGKNGFKYGIYTFFTGTISLLELF